MMTKLAPNYSWFWINSNGGRIGPFVWCNSWGLCWYITKDTYRVIGLNPAEILGDIIFAFKLRFCPNHQTVIDYKYSLDCGE